MKLTSLGARFASRIGRLGASFGRLVGKAIPDRYSGRLDRVSPRQQQDTISNRFRSGM